MGRLGWLKCWDDIEDMDWQGGFCGISPLQIRVSPDSPASIAVQTLVRGRINPVDIAHIKLRGSIGVPVNIVIVDDDQTFRTVLKRILAKDPKLNVVGVASDGLEALELARKLLPESGADAFLHKATGLAELLATLRQIAKGSE